MKWWSWEDNNILIYAKYFNNVSELIEKTKYVLTGGNLQLNVVEIPKSWWFS
jgi:hypothetical protein